jgi:hypothetical protein
MFYLSQPIAGLSLLTSQLFSGRDRILLGICPGLTNNDLAFVISMNIGIFIRLLFGLDVFQISRLHKAFNVACNFRTI